MPCQCKLNFQVYNLMTRNVNIKLCISTIQLIDSISIHTSGIISEELRRDQGSDIFRTEHVRRDANFVAHILVLVLSIYATFNFKKEKEKRII